MWERQEMGIGGVLYPCAAQPPPCMWSVLTVQLLTAFILHPEEHTGHWQSMYFQVLRCTGWLGGHAFPALGPYATPQQMRHTLARGLSRAVVQARPGPGGLAVIPVEEEQGKGTHHEEEEDPHSEACVVFDGLSYVFVAFLNIFSCPHN